MMRAVHLLGGGVVLLVLMQHHLHPRVVIIVLAHVVLVLIIIHLKGREREDRRVPFLIDNRSHLRQSGPSRALAMAAQLHQTCPSPNGIMGSLAMLMFSRVPTLPSQLTRLLLSKALLTRRLSPRFRCTPRQRRRQAPRRTPSASPARSASEDSPLPEKQLRGMLASNTETGKINLLVLKNKA
ncbi:hypothetical protein U0070_020994 [Myodes glareolus]|uniref:Uncharacterized protein n=1 Tax=Myodes glareolus TaxID=447135 RepID=A0AAW0HBV6_MYOGA